MGRVGNCSPGVPKALALLQGPASACSPLSLVATDSYLHFLHPLSFSSSPCEVGETILHADLLKVLLGHLEKSIKYFSLSPLLLLLGSRGSTGRKEVGDKPRFSAFL